MTYNRLRRRMLHGDPEQVRFYKRAKLVLMELRRALITSSIAKEISGEKIVERHGS